MRASGMVIFSYRNHAPNVSPMSNMNSAAMRCRFSAAENVCDNASLSFRPNS